MENLFGRWLLNLIVCFGFIAGGFTLEGSDRSKNVALHGQLTKQHFKAPRVVKNPPFGWFVQLDRSSRQKIVDFFSKLTVEDRVLFDNIPLHRVRLLTSDGALREWAHDHCNKEVTIQGKILDPELFGDLCAFRFYPEEVVPPITLEVKKRACARHISWETDLAEETVEDVLDQSLELPDSEPERLVSMTGKLILRILNSDPDVRTIEEGGHPIYCWIVELDQESFKIACSTPVRAAFHTPASIRSSKNGDELQLTGDFDEEWLCEHHNQTVTVQGYLWHAHTCHHHTPVMLDTNPWFNE